MRTRLEITSFFEIFQSVVCIDTWYEHISFDSQLHCIFNHNTNYALIHSLMISLFRSVFNGTLGFVFTARSFASNFVVASLFIYSGWQCGKKEMDSEICYTKSQTDIRRHKSDGTIGPDRRLISQQPIVFKCIFGSCQSTCK